MILITQVTATHFAVAPGNSQKPFCLPSIEHHKLVFDLIRTLLQYQVLALKAD